MLRLIVSLLAAATLLGCTGYGPGPGHGPAPAPNPAWRHYDWNHPDPSYGGYHAERYYREDRRYREHPLTRNDRIYRGMDGRYYCRRSDGTTGLVVGAATGAIFGNVISRGDSKALGTILGAAVGGLLGQQLDGGELRCR